MRERYDDIIETIIRASRADKELKEGLVKLYRSSTGNAFYGDRANLQNQCEQEEDRQLVAAVGKTAVLRNRAHSVWPEKEILLAAHLLIGELIELEKAQRENAETGFSGYNCILGGHF